MSEALRIGIPIKKLRPTQMTAGFREVELKRVEWRSAGRKHQPELLRKHVVPAVLGPGKAPYIVDHHHFALALLEEKAGDGLPTRRPVSFAQAGVLDCGSAFNAGPPVIMG